MTPRPATSGPPRARARPGPEEVLDRFRRRGALLEGHFLLSSGLHSPVYLQSALLLQHPDEAEALGRELGRQVRAALRAVGGLEQDVDRGGSSRSTETPPGAPRRIVDVVVSPALGGIVIGHELARALGARAVFAERQDARLTLRRGFGLSRGETAVVCEDVITTGGSAREVAALVEDAGAAVAAVAALVYRGEAESEPRLGAPLVTLGRVAAPVHRPASCPLCARGIPVVKPGSRSEA